MWHKLRRKRREKTKQNAKEKGESFQKVTFCEEKSNRSKGMNNKKKAQKTGQNAQWDQKAFTEKSCDNRRTAQYSEHNTLEEKSKETRA